MTEELTLTQDVPTTVGILASGSRVTGTAAGDGGWLIALPPRQRKPRAVRVTAEAVNPSGRTLAAVRRREMITYEFEFARRWLRYSREDAAAWVSRGYKVSLKTLHGWGLDIGSWT